MQAIILSGKNNIEHQEVPAPEKAAREHLVIKMQASAINSGDKLFISGAFPRGIPASRYDIAGVSGVGTVVETGPDVPAYYLGRKITIYRSLKYSEHTLGTWSEYAHLHYLNCAVLPDTVDTMDYAGSLVNTITPLAFLNQARQEGHKAIISTAGNSATGIALLGLCLASDMPLISIVRHETGKELLEKLGAKNILVQTDPSFREQFEECTNALAATVVFDGVGGPALNGIFDILPYGSTVYAYGFLGGSAPLSFPTSLLMRGISIKGFSNFRTETVQNPVYLERALQELSNCFTMPHFTTRQGEHFRFSEFEKALAFTSTNGSKAILMP